MSQPCACFTVMLGNGNAVATAEKALYCSTNYKGGQFIHPVKEWILRYPPFAVKPEMKAGLNRVIFSGS